MDTPDASNCWRTALMRCAKFSGRETPGTVMWHVTFARICEDNSQLAVKCQAEFGNGYEIGERLRATRKELALNQTEMAKVGGVTLNTQSRYESGGLPTLDYLQRIAGVGADWFWIITGQRIEADPLDSQTAQLVQLFKPLPDFVKSIALAQVRVLADQIPPENLDTPPPPDSEQQQATMHDQRQDYRHQ
ncbi:helix-turn-helix domain-containing protein [Sphingobium sp. B10D3B]|uniref:helix-turn-helix domain-containing protein n=2 Tax=Sphingomonadaceae TaxID=41297 RepID=UPI002227D528|nr:helix-turn-helix domain-containing protein [Sphingobium sp. B10D3B]